MPGKGLIRLRKLPDSILRDFLRNLSDYQKTYGVSLPKFNEFKQFINNAIDYKEPDAEE